MSWRSPPSPPPKSAAKPTRPKSNRSANATARQTKRPCENVKKEVKQGKLRPASLAFAKAAKALKSTHPELEGVPPPEADKATISKWLGQIKTEIGYFEAVSKKLKQGNKNAAEKMVIKLTHNVELANDTVLGL